MGNVFYTAEVLQSLLASNVAAKRKFQALYRKEEERILATSRHLLDLEAELGLDPRFQTDEFVAEFRRFRREREDFEKQSKRRGVRPRDVRRLKEAIHRILLRVEPAAAADFDATLDSTAGRAKTGQGGQSEPGGAPKEPVTPRPSGRPAVDVSWGDHTGVPARLRLLLGDELLGRQDQDETRGGSYGGGERAQGRLHPVRG